MEDNKKFMSLDDLVKMGNENYIKMINEGKITDIFRAIGLFPNQTVTNDVLILSQMPNATCVKRMKEWNFYHRQVKKNEKALKVISHKIEKYDQDYTDESGTVYTKGIEKLKHDVGFVFDMSQTEGQHFDYLNSNRETISAHFEDVKKALERTAKEYQFKYEDIENKSNIDRENKIISIKDGMDIGDIIETLIKDVSKVLLESRRAEGLSSKQKENIEDIEHNVAIYAIHSKLGLELPNYNFDEIKEYTTEDQLEFKNNLQKVRSVTNQLLANVESAIEYAIRGLNREQAKAKEEENEKQEEQAEEAVAEQPKRTRKKKQAESEVE